MEMFFANQQQMLAEDSMRARRTKAIIGMDDDIDFEEFAAGVDIQDDGKFGELGPDGKVINNEDEDDEEADDHVPDLDFEHSQKEDFFFGGMDRRQRHTSAIVSNTELFKGLAEIKKKGKEGDLDERLKMIANENDDW